MTRWRILVISACLAAVACEADPARSVKIVARPPAATDSVLAPPGTVTPPAVAAWPPQGCPPPPEDAAGPSALVVSGPCAFEHRGTVSCEGVGDDFLVTMSRPAAHGAQLMIYINVERYHGPGSYADAQMFLGVQEKTFIYRWSSDTVSITVGDDEAFVALPVTRVEAEPLLIECSGPMTNYQCSGRGDLAALEHSAEVVSGTLRCAERAQSDSAG